MAVTTLKDLHDTLATGDRVLGLDVGAKTIGLALSDPTRTVATPLETIRRRKFSEDLIRLKGIITEHRVRALVVGLPINMDGSEGPRAQSVRQFAANCAEAIDLPIAFWDERLSTAAVTRVLLDADRSRKRRSELVDKMAASFILQGALDFLRAAES
ncbi:MAG: Holliday junction resolvase RuvX [Alphaproteobacteria bacterium]|nr:MAG: Holliday junction resolvase RuvX [Alphaproteobacteria bacterium]